MGETTQRERAKQIGLRIKEARELQGMSQMELSRQMAALSGMESESVRRSLVNHETGKFAPRLRTLEVIAQITGQPLEFFVGPPEVDPPAGARFQRAA